jgi:hypothetical protein
MVRIKPQCCCFCDQTAVAAAVVVAAVVVATAFVAAAVVAAAAVAVAMHPWLWLVWSVKQGVVQVLGRGE